jgi:hypothetical protein
VRADPNGPLAVALQSLADVVLPLGAGLALIILAIAIGRLWK